MKNLFSFLSARRRDERELDAELRFHLDQQIQDNLAAGMPLEEAKRQAALEFGGLDRAKEACREVRPFAWIEQITQDLRYAGRQLLRAPAFALVTILTIAVGIGACTSIFSLVNAVLLRPLDFPESERIVLLNETRPPNQQIPLAPGIYLDWLEQASSFDHLAIHRSRSFNTRTKDKPVNVGAEEITANYFAVLGVRPKLGRTFRPDEEKEGQNKVVILSYRTWQQHFGAREDVINETLMLDDQPFTIVGVMPDKNLIWNPAVFVPLTLRPRDRSDYGSHGFFCLGRMKKGITTKQAQADMDVVCEQIAKAHPLSNSGHGAFVSPLLEDMTGDVRHQLLILLGAVGFVLLIACVNVASLLLARANSRTKEIAVRAALGASRGRIARQFLCESGLIVGLGGLLGTLLSYASLRTVAHFAGSYVPRMDEVSIDSSVLASALAATIAACLGVGLISAFQFTRSDPIEALMDSARGSSAGRKRQRLRAALVVGEIALAMMLLTASGLLARSLDALKRDDQGFQTDGIYFSSLLLQGKNYDTPEKIRNLLDQIIERSASLPNVEAVAFTSGLPMVSNEGLLFHVVGTPEVATKDMPNTSDFSVTPDFFRAMGIPVYQGRAFTSQDMAGSPRAVIINRELARRHFPGLNPVGQRLMIMTMADQPDAIREIVGVVGDIKPDGPRSHLFPQVYEPAAQRVSHQPHLVLKVKSGKPAPSEISDLIHELDPNLPIKNLRDYRSALAHSWFSQQFTLTVFSGFSAVALLLATIGIYGVMAYSVSQRTREIGIRLALGANTGNILRLIGAHGALVVGLGLILGLGGALISGRILRSLLFNTSPADPFTLLLMTAILGLIAMLACLVPVLRSTKVDPSITLRNE